jgi:hypothetical protein
VQTRSTGTNIQQTPFLLVLAGTVIAIVGTFMNWVTLGGTGLAAEETLKGTDASAGLGTLGLAVICIVLAIVMWVRGRSGRGRGQAIAAFIFALIALFAAAYSAFAAEDAIKQFEKSDVAELWGVSEVQAEAQLDLAFSQGVLTADPEIGAYISTLGTVLLVVGSFMGMRAAKQARVVAPSAEATTPPPVAQATGPGAAGPGAPTGTGPESPGHVPGATEPTPGVPPGGAAPPKS